MLIVCSSFKFISDLVLLRVDPPFEESEFIKPIQYNNDAANLGPVNVLNEVSMFKWIELSEDKTCKEIEVKGLPKQVMKTRIKIFEYVPEETDKTRSRHMIMYSDHRDDNACWGDNEGNSNNMQTYLIATKILRTH